MKLATARNPVATTTVLTALSFVSLVARDAAAQSTDASHEPAATPFGARGSFVISTGSSLSIDASQNSGTDRDSRFGATLTAAVDYFVARNLAVGVSAGASYADSKTYGADGSLVDVKTSSVSGGVRFGPNVPLGAQLAWYPRVTLGLASMHRDQTLLSGRSLSVTGDPFTVPSYTNLDPSISVGLPILFFPAPRFFVGAGPTFTRDFGGAEAFGQRTTFGGSFTVGGWLGGDPPESAGASDALATTSPARPARAFGDAHELVLSAGVSTYAVYIADNAPNASYTTYLGTDSSATSVNVSPGFDYFIARHVSVGTGLVFTYSNSRSHDGAAIVTNPNTVFGVAPRVGYDVPLNSWLSVFPRAAIAVGRHTYDEQSGASEIKGGQTYVGVGVDAPVLLHVAPHFFVGFGPYLSTDLTRPRDSGSTQSRTTTVGARFLVGGWI